MAGKQIPSALEELTQFADAGEDHAQPHSEAARPHGRGQHLTLVGEWPAQSLD